jgi:hypothetical protein
MMRGLPWLDLGYHRDAAVLLKERKASTEIRIDSKSERLDVTIHANGQIQTRRTWPKPAAPSGEGEK